MAEGKFPKRSLITAIKAATQRKSASYIIEFHRSSMHNGRLPFESNNPNALTEQMKLLSSFANTPSIIALGVQTDISFNGIYDDLEAVKKTSTVPIICNDFVIFAYQLFRVIEYLTENLLIEF